jgi:hypothetical protein
MVMVLLGCAIAVAGGPGAAPASAQGTAQQAPSQQVPSQQGTPLQGTPQPGRIETAYVVLGPDGPIARAVLSGTTVCPAVSVSGDPRPMRVRARPDAGPQARFPVLVCEALVPGGTTSLAVADRTLPLPPAALRTSVAIGDTGCRLKDATAWLPTDTDLEGTFQDCDDRAAWPFAPLSALAAADKPDLVIHVGDYIYREAPCPPGDAGCAGSPWGDTWATWQADLFGPAAPLLAAAPWLPARGNHELCARAGHGYLRFLHPVLATDDAPPACTDLLSPYTVSVAGQSIVVLDTSNAEDNCPASGCNSAPYAAQLATLAPPPESWLITHRPIWGIKRDTTLNAALQGAVAARGGRLPDGIGLVLSGHMHIFESLSFADGGPPQMIVGMSGTSLETAVDRPLAGLAVGGRTVAEGRSAHRFGFVRFAREPAGWRATFVDPAGDARFVCSLRTDVLTCR